MQSLPVDQVILILSTNEFPKGELGLPSRLRRLVKDSRGRICIHFTVDNKRSYKKLLPVLKLHPDAVVLTADDDVLYWRSWAYKLEMASQRFPGCIVGTRGSRISAIHGTARAYSSWPSGPPDVEGHSVFLTGRGGILYPPFSLDVRVHDWETASRLCPSGDDIWFKAMATLAGVKAVRINTGREYPSNGASQRDALWTRNLSQNENDVAFKAVVDHFDLWEKYDESP
jgi:hypothetical protein